jgi:hypothetical protein
VKKTRKREGGLEYMNTRIEKKNKHRDDGYSPEF